MPGVYEMTREEFFKLQPGDKVISFDTGKSHTVVFVSHVSKALYFVDNDKWQDYNYFRLLTIKNLPDYFNDIQSI